MLIRMRHAVLGAAVVALAAGVQAAIVGGAVTIGYIQARPTAAPVSFQADGTTVDTAPEPPPRQLIVPDLFAVLPAGITTAQLRTIGRLAGVRAVLAVDGGQVVINGRAARLLGVPPQAFRSWTPPATAAASGIWTSLAGGRLIASETAAGRLGLVTGDSYPVSAAVGGQVSVGVAAALGIPGVDAIVSSDLAARLGLAADVAVLVNAPGADLGALMRQVRDILGSAGTVANLIPTVTSLPVDDHVPVGRPANWLQLYQESAAEYCPGLSWTVLAAIGEIESGDGADDGPSSAGALGPMQFLPSTWQAWGIDAFGLTGPPDIMNPLDAVPSAARLLCAGGAARGGTELPTAIFDYNHADWYVSEVLALAGEYAREYP